MHGRLVSFDTFVVCFVCSSSSCTLLTEKVEPGEGHVCFDTAHLGLDMPPLCEALKISEADEKLQLEAVEGRVLIRPEKL